MGIFRKSGQAIGVHPHHQRTIERLVATFCDDPNYLALIVAGSLARGWARPDSDVDIILVASEAEYARRAPTRATHYFNSELCDYPGGYVDGKIINLAYLQDVAERGSEPSRAALVGAWAAYSREPGLAALLERIPAYPEATRAERMQAYFAQMKVWQWYMGEAEKRDDAYLRLHTATSLVLFGGRLLLAHNRILFPYHKWFQTVLDAAPEKPDNLRALIDALLAAPSRATANAFCQAIFDFAPWPAPPEGWPARFMEDTEWAWRRGVERLEDG